MSSIDRLANIIAQAVHTATSTIGMAERAIVSGQTVITSHGAYTYDVVCPVALYDGKSVWVLITADKSTAVIIGD